MGRPIFSGVSNAEAWAFALESTWIAVPPMLLQWRTTFGWQPRWPHVWPASSLMCILSTCTGFMHWQHYAPGSSRQLLDVVTVSTHGIIVLYESASLISSASLVSVAEGQALRFMFVSFIFLSVLDMFTDGAWRHLFLRTNGLLLLLFSSGYPASDGVTSAARRDAGFVLVLSAWEIAWSTLHHALCLHVARRWRLEARSPSLVEWGLGLGASSALVAMVHSPEIMAAVLDLRPLGLP